MEKALKYYLQFDQKMYVQNYSYQYLNHLQSLYKLPMLVTGTRISSPDFNKSQQGFKPILILLRFLGPSG